LHSHAGLRCDPLKTTISPTLQPGNETGTYSRFYAIPLSRIRNDIGAVKRRAQAGGMRNLPAQAATYTAIDDLSDGIFA